jgi:transcriptional regulator with XRE-family HTH domain
MGRPVAVLDFSGVLLREYRNKAGLSREALADLSCRSAHTLRAYECGNQRPSTQAIRALSRALGISYSQLLSCEDAPADA